MNQAILDKPLYELTIPTSGPLLKFVGLGIRFSCRYSPNKIVLAVASQFLNVKRFLQAKTIYSFKVVSLLYTIVPKGL